jgi:biotin carboxyl carrier protein
MFTRVISVLAGAAFVVAFSAMGQAQNPSSPSSGALQGTMTARVETAALELSLPERFQVPSVLEPVRRVTLMAPTDGILRAMTLAVGAMARDGQEVADLDRAEAKARVKIAEASVKEMQAEAKSAAGKGDQTIAAIAEARLDAAKARSEIAHLELDRCSLRAPFAGRVLSASVSIGQYVAKGSAIADLADVSSLRVLVPVDRTAVKAGATLELVVEGKTIGGKVATVLPLPETFSVLRELATPWAGAWVSFDNLAGGIEPGQRVHSPWLPDAPIATVPSRAVQNSSSGGGAMVQVLRNEFVSNIPVHVLGPTGPERTQVSGPLRPNDVLIVETSKPLAAGTFLRFENEGAGRPVEGLSPRPGETGAVANITPPNESAGRVAPIGSPGALSTGKGATPSKPAAKPATKPAPKASATPF